MPLRIPRLPIALVAAAALLVPAAPASAAPTPPTREIFVSPSGSNGGAGTEASPFRTLEKARAAIRVMNAQGTLPDGGVTVTLRGGDYVRDTSFTLGAQDGGTVSAPITYRAYPGETVRLTGGAALDGDEFVPATTDGIGGRLRGDVRDRIVQYDLAAAGIADLGGIMQTGYGLPPGDEPAEIFLDGTPMVLARYPDAGAFARVGTVVDPGGNPRQVLGGNATTRPLPEVYDHGATFRYTDPRPETWASTEGAWMYGYWYWDWADGNLPIASVDPATDQIATASASHYAVRAGQRYYYYNVPEELDAPGEYYLDRDAAKLYFLPPADLAGKTVDLSLLTDPVVVVDGASNVRFDGIQVANSRGNGIVIRSGDHNTVEHGVVADLGGWGVRIEGGTGNAVRDSEITRVGHGGAFVGGGDRPSLAAAGNEASGNTIHAYSRLALTYNPGVMLSGVGNRAADNHIFEAPHQAIAFEGNDHVIEYNDVHDVVTSTADSGAIYSVRNWSWTGTVIRYNYIHDIGGKNAPSHDQEGIYLDDLTSGITVTGNILENVPLPFLIGGGRSNVIENNLVIGSGQSMSLDNRGLGWAKGHCAPGGGMEQSLTAMPYTQEPWASAYPWLVTLLQDQPCVPKNNSVQRNVFSAAPSIAKEAAQTGTVAGNWVADQDLRFVDQVNGDLTLSPDSPVFAKVPGFEPLPFDRMRKSTKEPLDLGLAGWSGTGHPSTAQVHGGSNSQALVADREVLTHFTGAPRTDATVTAWFYDDAADTSLQAAVNASMGDTGTLYRALGVATPTSATHYVYRAGASFVATTVPRTTGWHRFEWEYTAGGLTMRIDGATVAQDAASTQFDRVQLGDWWADNRSGDVYFDDVSID